LRQAELCEYDARAVNASTPEWFPLFSDELVLAPRPIPLHFGFVSASANRLAGVWLQVTAISSTVPSMCWLDGLYASLLVGARQKEENE